jgi:hypothetical protein
MSLVNFAVYVIVFVATPRGTNTLGAYGYGVIVHHVSMLAAWLIALVAWIAWARMPEAAYGSRSSRRLIDAMCMSGVQGLIMVYIRLV